MRQHIESIWTAADGETGELGSSGSAESFNGNRRLRKLVGEESFYRSETARPAHHRFVTEMNLAPLDCVAHPKLCLRARHQTQ